MKIKIELMGALADYHPDSKHGFFEFNIGEKSTIDDLLELLNIKRKVNFAVNGDEEKDMEYLLSEGDEVIFFTVISGG